MAPAHASAECELLLRVVVGDDRSRRDDVVASVTHGHTVGDLVVALSRHLGFQSDRPGSTFRIERSGEVPLPPTSLTEVDLRSGDVVVLGTGCAHAHPTSPVVSEVVLDVTAGPDSGRSYAVVPGVTTVGRSRRADVSLSDPAVSRGHLMITLTTSGRLTVVVDPMASNGITVAGEPLAPGATASTLTAAAAGTVIGLGSTRLVVRRVAAVPVGRPAPIGRVDLPRVPLRTAHLDDTDPAPIGPIPSRPEPRRAQVAAVIIPLLVAIAMFAFSRHAQFLLIMLVSPLIVLGSALDDRRTGRRRSAVDETAFRWMIETHCVELRARSARVHAHRHRMAPDIAELVRRARHHTSELWERDRDDPMAGVLRLGLGDDRAGLTTALQPGGDTDLRAQAQEALAACDELRDVPLNADPFRWHLALCGPRDLVGGVAASLLVQAATLHSPADLAIAVVASHDHGLGWAKWLPHLRSPTPPMMGGSHLAGGPDAAGALVERLTTIAAAGPPAASRTEPDPPRLLAILDAMCDPTAVERLIEVADRARVGVIWLSEHDDDVPRGIGQILTLGSSSPRARSGRLRSLDPTVAEQWLDVEWLGHDVATSVARALAPLRDLTAAAGRAAPPVHVPLFEVLGLAEPDPGAVLQRWSSGGRGLRVALGAGAGGPVEVDLVDDGPHALVAGTSGSGKSELVQTIVAGLAVGRSPRDVTFLFVDFKGGASTQAFRRLPHTVGHVTNLSPDLAARALTSLRAELERRMALLDGRAKDITEFRERHPDEAVPSLVIVIDEFATLVAEIPEFAAGIVDVAQRGRSLGIHLLLATQRPSGSVDDHILANTNLRIALRVLDRAESTAVIGTPDAGDIAASRRGRAFVRSGPRAPIEFQCAHGGAPFRPPTHRSPVTVARFDPWSATAGPTVSSSVETSTSQLDALVDAVVRAHAASGDALPRRPWHDELPASVSLDELWPAAEVVVPGRDVVIGLVDRPEAQDQRPAVVDLEATGGLLVLGSGGSGRTTLLRAIAAGVELAGAGAVTLALDFGSHGLATIGCLPSVIDVASGDDLEAVTRHLAALDAELARRRGLLAAAGAQHLTAHRADEGATRLDRIVVLVDGFDALSTALFAGPAASGADRWSEILHRIVTAGRRVGIHTVIAADRRVSVPASIQSALGARLVLRHADPQAYLELGLRPDRTADLDRTAGRGLLDGDAVQVAVPGPDPSAEGQAAALARLARRSAVRSKPVGVPPSAALAEHLRPGELPMHAIGAHDIGGEPALLDLSDSHAAVIGPPRSGRSTAIAAVVRAHPEGAFLLGPMTSPLSRAALLPADRVAFGEADVVGSLLDRVASRAAARPDGPTIVVAVDDLEEVDDPLLEPIWRRLFRSSGVRLVASVEPRSVGGFASSHALTVLRRSRRLLVLRPDDPSEFVQLTGVRWPGRPGLRWVPGRGVLVAEREPSIIQVADHLAGPDASACSVVST